MPSFGHGVVAGVPKIRGAFVSFSQNSSSGRRAVRRGADVELVRPELASATHGSVAPSVPAVSFGRSTVGSHVHSLRNQRVGSTWMVGRPPGPRCGP